MEIVDAHVHIWAADAPPYAWDHSGGFEPPYLAPCEDLLVAMDAAGVRYALVVQPSCYGYDNRYVLTSVRQHGDRLAGMVLVDPLSPDGPDRLQAWVEEYGAQGLRLNAAREPACRWLEDPATYPLWERAIALHVPIGLLLEPHQLPAAAITIARYPEAVVIIDHLARLKPAQPAYREHLERLLGLSQYPRVYVKLSGFYALSAEAYPHVDLCGLVQAVEQAFGAERTMYASDFPLASQEVPYGEVLSLLDRLLPDLDAPQRTRIFGRTAMQLFGFG
jgi:L-fuconolactonase